MRVIILYSYHSYLLHQFSGKESLGGITNITRTLRNSSKLCRGAARVFVLCKYEAFSKYNWSIKFQKLFISYSFCRIIDYEEVIYYETCKTRTI